MIIVDQIDLGEIESFEEHTVDEVVGLLSHRLADMVNDFEDYEIIAAIRFDKDRDAYVSAGTARHKTRDMSCVSQSVTFGVSGDSYRDLNSAARKQAEEFFEASNVSIELGGVTSIGDKYIVTVTAHLV